MEPQKMNTVLEEKLNPNPLGSSKLDIEVITPEIALRTIKLRAAKKGIDFVIDESNEGPIKLLCQYFSLSPQFEEDGRSLKKGLMLCGNLGTGKTLLMHLCRKNDFTEYIVVNCRKVASEFSTDGDMGIQPYKIHPKRFGNEYCFDDFGHEPIKYHYGSKIDVMEDVLLARYDFGSPFTHTHITTNKTANEIKERYGDRIADRFREMFNIIEFPLTAKSRRK
jgi:hypothetical protein